MNRLTFTLASLALASAATFGAGCSSSSPSGGGGGSGSSSGGSGSSSGGIGPGACALFLDGGAVSCLVTTVNGTNTSGPPCGMGLTYETMCPTTGLVGCCNRRDSSDSKTMAYANECYYLIGDASLETQAMCEGDGGLGTGTWSTSAP